MLNIRKKSMMVFTFRNELNSIVKKATFPIKNSSQNNMMDLIFTAESGLISSPADCRSIRNDCPDRLGLSIND